MFRFIDLCFGTLVRLLRARRSLLLENLALRQQLAVLKRRHPRPRLDLLDKLFWVAVRRFWSGWQQSLIVVTPETVVRWHRAGFRLYWKLISKVRRPVGRRQTSKGIQELIFRMVFESPWQNGVAERWMGSCRRDLLDHIIAVDEHHLKRRLSEDIRYYHEDRRHLGLGKGTPDGRTRTIASSHVLSHPRLGGLHHRYD